MKIIGEFLRSKSIEKTYVIEHDGDTYHFFKWHTYHYEHGDDSGIDVSKNKKSLEWSDVPDELADYVLDLELY